MAKFVHGVVVVIRQNFTIHEMVKRAREALNFADAKILGYVLNDVNLNAYGYGYGRLYGYRYGYKYYRYGYKYSYKNDFTNQNYRYGDSVDPAIEATVQKKRNKKS